MSFAPLFNWLLPPKCELCERHSTPIICTHCEQELNLSVSFRKHLDTKIQLFALGDYQNPLLKKLIQEIKFNGNQRLAHWVSHAIKGLTFNIDISLLIPVPSHINRLQQRPFNHVHAIFRHLLLSYPSTSCIVRTRDTPHLFDQSKPDRIRLLKGAFKVREPASIQNQSIVLLDDIVSTGATILELSRCLLPYRPRSISVISLSH